MSNTPNPSQVYHDTPPTFSASSRKRLFYIDKPFTDTVLSKIRNPRNKVFASLMYGYFTHTHQFFGTAHQRDIDYLSSQFAISDALTWKDYNKDAKRVHRELILSFMGYQAFDISNIADTIKAEILTCAKVRKDKKKCFASVANLLAREKIEIPPYQTIKNLIDNQYKVLQDALIKQVTLDMSPDTQRLLDKLFTKSKYDETSEQYRIAALKRFSHKLRPQQIKQNVDAFDTLHELFSHIQPILDRLSLPVETIKHYATQIKRSQVFQVTRKAEADRYLLTICFIAHQYYTLQDVFVETLQSSVISAFNSAERDARARYYETRHQQTQHINTLLEDSGSILTKYIRIKAILSDDTISDANKLSLLNNLVADPSRSKSLNDSIEDVKEDQKQLSGEALFFHYLELGSRRLQNRCNRIIERLSFSEESLNAPLCKAVQRFSMHNCNVDETFPIGFMSKKEQRYVDTPDRFVSSLYKVLLFNHIVQAIKGDGLHLKYSYRHMMLDDYMIPITEFEENYEALVEQSNTKWLTDFTTVYDSLDKNIHAQFQETNEHILANNNQFIQSDGDGGIKTAYQRKNMLDMAVTASEDIELYPSDETIPLSEVLSVVDNASGFLDMFQHYSGEDITKKPNRKTMIAAIVCKGLHFTDHKFGKLCEAVNNTSLTTAANNYLSTNNASLASDKIVNFADGMGLSKIYMDGDKLYTSSDGQKYSMSVDSLNAAPSYKYGGKDKVIVSYNFLDSRHLSIHSNVISGWTREAHYMIDGVLNNDVVKTDMHVTDTHGFTEVVMAMSHLVGINFAPRIKNFLKQQLYSTRGKKTYSHKNYPILPKERIKPEKISVHWRQIQRLVISLKLGRTTASQIFKRLNSYSSANHPIYEALKAYGRIIKTIHLLKYIDDSELRVAMTKQLNKGESANKLDRALAIGRSEYHLPSHEEQETMETCKRLIKNAIVCWNYMYLTKRYYALKTREERVAFITKVKESSTLAWEHFMIHGAFDFSESRLKDSRHFDLDKMLDPSILKDIL